MRENYLAKVSAVGICLYLIQHRLFSSHEQYIIKRSLQTWQARNLTMPYLDLRRAPDISYSLRHIAVGCLKKKTFLKSIGGQG